MKRGISPLIATVLILGFTVALSAIVITWGTGFVRLQQESTEAIALKQITCNTDVGLKIRNAEISGNKVKLLIESIGEKDINKFNVRVFGDNGTDVLEISSGLTAYNISLFEANFDTSIGIVKEVDVFPRIILGGEEVVCSNTFYKVVIDPVSVPPSDTTPPFQSNGTPVGTLPNGTTSTTISLDTDESATCRYSNSSGISYSSMTNTFSTTGGTSHSTLVTGLNDNRTYNYYIRCLDLAGNANPSDFTINFSVDTSSSSTVSCLKTDLNTYSVPATGPYSYASFRPSQPGFLQLGDSYNDPNFCSRITRVTAHFPLQATGRHYVKNGFWNADGTLFLGGDFFPNTPDTSPAIYNSTGALVRFPSPGSVDASFDPVNPDLMYHSSGNNDLMQYSVSLDSSSVLHTFGGSLSSLGGSVDWISADGRYMVVIVGTQAVVWDKQNNVEYSGGPGGAVDTGWLGMSPDGNWLVTPGNKEFRSYRINHTNLSVDSVGTIFWTLCGDHGDIVSASNGKTYVVTAECWSDPGTFAVDITIPQTGVDAAARQKQRDDNLRLIPGSWSATFDPFHVSGISRGPLQDWAVISLGAFNATDGAYYTNSPTEPWYLYMNEIVMANVLTGEVRRLAHFRSDPDGYCSSARASVNWDGTKILYVSNFGEDSADSCGYGDMYVLDIPQSSS